MNRIIVAVAVAGVATLLPLLTPAAAQDELHYSFVGCSETPQYFLIEADINGVWTSVGVLEVSNDQELVGLVFRTGQWWIQDIAIFAGNIEQAPADLADWIGMEAFETWYSGDTAVVPMPHGNRRTFQIAIFGVMKRTLFTRFPRPKLTHQEAAFRVVGLDGSTVLEYEDTCHASYGRGNNGVGNGVDPQPRGDPPINDAPGDVPGAPGNQGGSRE